MPGRRRPDRPAAGRRRAGSSRSPSSTLGRLTDVEQFENIIVKRHARTAGIVRIKDVGRVELGAKNQDVSSQRRRQADASASPIFQLPDANALDTADRVKAKMDELKQGLPRGRRLRDRLRHHAVHPRVDQRGRSRRCATPIILVAIVVLLFLQNWRSAIIPLVAVPVAIIGTFAVMAAIGFSLNNLTLFGLVLAIGIVVDDAIVVVEAVEHHIEQGLAPREATHQGDGAGVRAGRSPSAWCCRRCSCRARSSAASPGSSSASSR